MTSRWTSQTLTQPLTETEELNNGAQKMLQLLFVLFLLLACGGASLDPEDVIYIYEEVPPIVTKIVQALTPTPTFSWTKGITDYFVFASSPSCERVTYRFTDSEPFQSILCRDSDVAVRFDEWLSSAVMEEYHVSLMSGEGITITNINTWHDNANPDNSLGKLYEYTKGEYAILIWTVTDAGIGSLSGVAQRSDGNQDALYEWWSKIGSDHN